jgi:FMN phosphatase YigB (HAD superfamily)
VLLQSKELVIYICFPKSDRYTHLPYSLVEQWVRLFDGMVISCRVQKVKPEVEIYQHLLTEYKLAAEETVFIDDMDVNLVAAKSMGINTIKFANSAQCRRDLGEFKCI